MDRIDQPRKGSTLKRTQLTQGNTLNKRSRKCKIKGKALNQWENSHWIDIKSK